MFSFECHFTYVEKGKLHKNLEIVGYWKYILEGTTHTSVISSHFDCLIAFRFCFSAPFLNATSNLQEKANLYKKFLSLILFGVFTVIALQCL